MSYSSSIPRFPCIYADFRQFSPSNLGEPDKEENVHLKNLTESSEDIKEDQYIDVTKLPNIRIDSSMLRDAVYHKMTM